MKNPLLNLIDPKMGNGVVPRASSLIIGLLQDFWKDGPDNPLLFFAHKEGALSAANTSAVNTSPSPASRGSLKFNQTRPPHFPAPSSFWHATASDIEEQMFGAGVLSPGGDLLTDKMVKPFSLTKEMSLLDLSAGLGTVIRKVAADCGASVTGLEADKDLAGRAMALSVMTGKAKQAPIDHYDRENLSLTRLYDCVIARDIFHKVIDKSTFFKLVAVAVKPRGQMSFTDFILDPADLAKPAITTWLDYEGHPAPLSLTNMTDSWERAGIKIRVTEDLTATYIKDTLRGLQQLALFLKTGVQPNSETKQTLHRELGLWTHRLAALQHGLTFYRFYGTKA